MPFTFPRSSRQHPQRLEMFTELAKRIPAHDSGMASAVQQLVSAYKSVTDLKARLARDATLTDGAKLVKLAKLARSSVAPLMDRLDNAARGMEERKAHLRGEIEQVYNPSGKSYETVMRHQEIRAMFRKMSQTEALKALDSARVTRDEDTMLALIEVQPFLSGLPETMHTHTRSLFIEAKAQEQAKALKVIAEQEELTTLFKAEMADSIAAMVDFVRADSIMDAAREDTAAA